jgi:hypothetical protein
MKFWLSRSLFTNFLFFIFPWWNSSYQEAFLTNFFFFTMEFWLLGSLSHEHLLFTMEFWLSRSLSHELFFHDGILAITKPFWRTFSFSRWNSGYHEAFLTNFFFFTMEFWLSWSLSHELFLFHDGIQAITKPFLRTFSFSRWNFADTQFGRRLFSYILQRVFT